MGQQEVRAFGVGQQGPRRAAEERLAETAMAVGSRHQQSGALVCRHLRQPKARPLAHDLLDRDRAHASQLQIVRQPLRVAPFPFAGVEPFRILESTVESSRKHFWVRLKTPLGDDPAEHQRFFAYASDLHILHAGLAPIGIGFADDHLQTASLDHSIWFHDRFRVDEWLLYALDSPATMGARALGRGNVFTADGRLVASVAQEGLVRMLATPRGHTL